MNALWVRVLVLTFILLRHNPRNSRDSNDNHRKTSNSPCVVLSFFEVVQYVADGRLDHKYKAVEDGNEDAGVAGSLMQWT